MQMRGTVRFRFRSPENNIDVIIEGESNVVESLRQELGLQGRVGFIQPLSARLVDDSELESHAAMGDGENLSNILTEEEKLPGPPPDPSSIPAVVRRIGDLDIKSKISELDGPSRTEPQIEYIREFFRINRRTRAFIQQSNLVTQWQNTWLQITVDSCRA